MNASAEKFLKNFDPSNSSRNRKKKTIDYNEKKFAEGLQRSKVYDEKGVHIQTNQDLCDCLQKDCPGCHFMCTSCRSPKCGFRCRRNRTWKYNVIKMDEPSPTGKESRGFPQDQSSCSEQF